MNVKIKVVVFPYKETATGLCYGSYCPELRYFFEDESADGVIKNLERHLLQELSHRLRYKNLVNRGWEVSENSAIPPTFTNEETVKLAEALYEIRIVEPEIIELNVELPPVRNLWK